MQDGTTRSRWIMVVIMFLFLLINQSLVFFIEPITALVSEHATFSGRWFNVILPVDVIFMLLFLMVWGILFDRHSRKRMLSIAGFLWGATAWLMGISPTFATFNLSKAAFGISRASYSGIFALVGDLFKPTNRSKILSLLLLAQPLAIVLGTVLQNIIELESNWRPMLIFFGAIGFLITLAIHLKFVDPKRGAKEPALTNIPVSGSYLLDWDTAKMILAKPSLVLIYVLIFMGTIPVMMLLEGMFIFLRDVQGLAPGEIFSSMLPTMFGVVLGYPIGGFFGDFFFRYKKVGRLLPCIVGSIVPPMCLYFAFRLTDVQGQTFFLCVLLVSFFMAFTLPNLFASIMDITLPEVRASAVAIGLIFQTFSILIAPMIFSFGLNYLPVGDLILWMCVGPWTICLVLYGGLWMRINKDIEDLRRHMAYRSFLEVRLTQSETR